MGPRPVSCAIRLHGPGAHATCHPQRQRFAQLPADSMERRETSNTNGAESVALFFGFLLGPEFFDGGADVGFPREGFVLGRVVGRELGDLDVHLLE